MRADQVEAARQLLMPVLEGVAGDGAERFSQLRRRHLGTGGCPGTAGTRTSLAAADWIGESSQSR